ncbi:hypothetical protein BX600DRAFT_224479 [Xylariales sp. PMI_506]|nr:hypothetical protein BX600DRAFT_224479 [Xylariales sp. PMI_506]
MSSMLKKTGGLSFKPKAAPRRPGGASTPSTTIKAPTTEIATQSQPPLDPQEAPKDATKDVLSESARPPKAPQLEHATQASSTTEIPTTSQATSPSIDRVPATIAKIPGNPPISDVNGLTPSSAATSESAPSTATPKDAESTRHPLPRPTPAAKQPATTPKETTINPRTASTLQGLPSPAATALASSSTARTLLSPSPFPVVDSITAIPPSEVLEPGPSAEATPPSTEVKKKRQYRKRQITAEGGEAENGEASSAVPKPKRVRKKKDPPAEGQEGANTAIGPDDSAAPSKRARYRRRDPTPEDAENRTLDHAITKIGELTKDLGIGKKFKHADLIVERQRQARHEAKMRKIEKQKRVMGLLPAEDSTDGSSRNGTPAPGDSGTPAPTSARPGGPGIGYDVINGQIVINPNSLVIDQHAQESNVQLETVEEDEFTHLTTSATYMRASRSMGTNHWTDEETERFYHYLSMFGTDFETISHVFPEKNRRMVKLKFNREEKLRPNRVNAAIMARGRKKVTIDLEDYKANRRVGDVWITQDKFVAETEMIRAERERELEKKRQERRDLGLLDDDPAPVKKSGGEADEELLEEEEITEEVDGVPTEEVVTAADVH